MEFSRDDVGFVLEMEAFSVSHVLPLEHNMWFHEVEIFIFRPILLLTPGPEGS